MNASIAISTNVKWPFQTFIALIILILVYPVQGRAWDRLDYVRVAEFLDALVMHAAIAALAIA
jgi:hypothetical protein